MRPILRVIKAAEHAVGGLWSFGELALAALRRGDLRGDPNLEPLLHEIATYGFYQPVDPESVVLQRDSRGTWSGPNPYRSVESGAPAQIVARSHFYTPHANKLLIVCHPYGVPDARFMARAFGLNQLLGWDIVYNVMSHHAPGSYTLWPGSSLASMRISRFLENMRSAVHGVQASAVFFRERYRYEKVAVFGYSIGGHLALHAANTAAVDQVIAYCPMVCLHAALSQIGLMRWVSDPINVRMVKRSPEYNFAALKLTDPLRAPLAIAEESLHVIAQTHDTYIPLRQVERVREKYPAIKWSQFNGTHGFMAGRAQVRSTIQAALTPTGLVS